MTTAGTRGYDCELNFGGDELAYAQDVDPKFDAEEIEVTTRASNGWAEFLQGKKSWNVDAGVLWIPSNAVVRAIRDAYLNASRVAIKIRDEDGYGWNGNIIVTSIGNPQPLNDALTMPVTLRGTGEAVAVDGDS